jgi:molybdenum cofactor guanylyltransferase
MDTDYRSQITACIIAGGESRRMLGNDKSLLEILGKPLIQYSIDRIKPQVSGIIINANPGADAFLKFGFPVVVDDYSGHQGPLAGIAACMAITDTQFLACIPCDSPVFPEDLIERLFRSLQKDNADIATVYDGQRTHPVFALLKITLLGSLRDYLENGQRKVDKWYANHKLIRSDFSDKQASFLNINSQQDYDSAIEYLSKSTKDSDSLESGSLE